MHIGRWPSHSGNAACNFKVPLASLIDSRSRVLFVSTKDSDLAHRGHGTVEITSEDVASFRGWTHQEFREVVDLLSAASARRAAGRLTAARFAEIETMVGFTWNPSGLVATAPQNIHLTDTVTYDWVHSCLQDGVFNTEMSAFLVATGTPRSSLQRCLRDRDWLFPKYRTSHCKLLHRIFDERRVSSENPNKVKGTCSEMLGAFGLVRHWMECEMAVAPAIQVFIDSFSALCKVLDLLLAAKQVSAIPPDEGALPRFGIPALPRVSLFWRHVSVRRFVKCVAQLL